MKLDYAGPMDKQLSKVDSNRLDRTALFVLLAYILLTLAIVLAFAFLL
jgi:hypothetical protein